VGEMLLLKQLVLWNYIVCRGVLNIPSIWFQIGQHYTTWETAKKYNTTPLCTPKVGWLRIYNFVSRSLHCWKPMTFFHFLMMSSAVIKQRSEIIGVAEGKKITVFWGMMPHWLVILLTSWGACWLHFWWHLKKSKLLGEMVLLYSRRAA
jgi:hypothetical protein